MGSVLKPPPVRLLAECGAPTGVGVASQATRAALHAAGVPLTFCDLAAAAAGGLPGTDAPALNLIHANPDKLALIFDTPERLKAVLGGLPTIGYWVWEAARIPDFWRHWLPLVEELWVPSRFVADCIRSQVEVPVTVMPHAISPPDDPSQVRLKRFKEKFLFLSVLNARSYLLRKNPMGLIRAYRQAFPDGNGDTFLLIKTLRARPEELQSLHDLAMGRPDILVTDGELSAASMARLLRACDCYVSLHRSEGFGLSLAEAMSLGKPVIATGYSGNLDFMRPDTAYLSRYRMARTRQEVGMFPAGTVFADADLDHASQLLREVHADPFAASAKGARAADWIRGHLSPDLVGRQMRLRLEAFMASRRAS